MMVRETMSAAIMKIAPINAEAGSRRPWRTPTTRRAAWGMTRPMKPIEPTMLTITAVIKAGRACQDDIDAAHGNAEGASRFRSKGERVQRPRMPEADDKPKMAMGRASETSAQRTPEGCEQPEHDSASLFGIRGLGDDEGGQRVEKLRPGDAGQDDCAVTAPCPQREEAHKRECDERSEKSTERHGEQACTKAEYRNTDGACRCPGGDTKNVWIRQRIAQERLSTTPETERAAPQQAATTARLRR